MKNTKWLNGDLKLELNKKHKQDHDELKHRHWLIGTD